MCLFTEETQQSEHFPNSPPPANPGNLEPKVDLCSWVNRLKAKETLLKCSRNRDLRLEVLVTRAFHKAHQQMEEVKRQRLQKWEQLKKTPRCLGCFCLPSLCCCQSNNAVILHQNSKKITDDEDDGSKRIDDFLDSLGAMSLKRKSQRSNNENSSRRAKVAKLSHF